MVTTREVSFATRWRDAAQLPSGPAQRARRLVRDTVISLRAIAHRGSESRFLRCLFCHYVFDDQRESFERIIQRLQRIGTFVSTDECIAMVRGERPIDGRHFRNSFAE